MHVYDRKADHSVCVLVVCASPTAHLRLTTRPLDHVSQYGRWFKSGSKSNRVAPARSQVPPARSTDRISLQSLSNDPFRLPQEGDGGGGGGGGGGDGGGDDGIVPDRVCPHPRKLTPGKPPSDDTATLAERTLDPHSLHILLFSSRTAHERVAGCSRVHMFLFSRLFIN